jgi:hypothetical protein
VTHTYRSMVTGNTHMAEIWHKTKESGEQVDNRVRIKLAGCLAPEATPTDCREVEVLGETERDRRNRLGKENIGAARRKRATLGWYHDQPRPINLSGPRDCRLGSTRVGFVRCSVLPQLLSLAATADPRPARQGG